MEYNYKKPRPFAEGMGEAVARRTILRQKNQDETPRTKADVKSGKPFRWETWGEVADRVAQGNHAIWTHRRQRVNTKKYDTEFRKLRDHIANGSILMSGRHLQHGDDTEPTRNIEVFSNCSTASTSFWKFYLLLNGSGVGRSYDDDLMVVDWSKQPFIHVVLDETHPDYDFTCMESLKQVQHKYGKYDCIVFEVQDSREGWAKALEYLETLIFEGNHENDVVIFDFSKVRCCGSLIGGMQLRPSSGPVPTMNMFNNIKSLKGCKKKPWWQTMYVDHYAAESVLVGGARRSARICIKNWRDPDIIDYINIKKNWTIAAVKDEETGKVLRKSRKVVPLWSANNSVGVDDEFWKEHKTPGTWAKKVFDAIINASYTHGTGEPGIVNLHKLQVVRDEKIFAKNSSKMESDRYTMDHGNKLCKRLLEIIQTKKWVMIPNPCQSGDTLFLTTNGAKQLKDVVVGDVVWTGYTWSRICNKTNNGVKPVYRYHLSNNTHVDMTEDHQVMCDGFKTPVQYATQIDRQRCAPDSFGGNSVDCHVAILAGLVLGDGSQQKNGGICSYLRVGGKDKQVRDYVEMMFVTKDVSDNVKTLLKLPMGFSELHLDYAPVWERKIPEFWKQCSSQSMCWFLRGLFSANGSVIVGTRVSLKTSCQEQAEDVQEMLEWLGINSYITINKPTLIEWENGEYVSRTSYDVNTSDTATFIRKIGFLQEYKCKAVKTKRKCTKKDHVEIIRVEYLRDDTVYDFTVESQYHTVAQKGLLIGNCGEISLFIHGGYCVITDLALYHCATLAECEEACRLAVRALIRTNMLKNIYNEETERTNRIGVSLTGIQEFAWKFFKLSFRDLLDGLNGKSLQFWKTIAKLSNIVREESIKCAGEYKVSIPHTCTTIKPSGSVSKLFGLTEGAHLPAMARYFRWVQFRKDDPLVQKYRDTGHKVKDLKQYEGTSVVCFPTETEICKCGATPIVTATEATMEEQYQWLQLLETFWLCGGQPKAWWGNQVSYTLKYDKKKVSLTEFTEMISKWQPIINTCSVMPTISDMDEAEYEYLPEEPVSLETYNEYVRNLKGEIEQDIGREHIECTGGNCPVDFQK